MAKKKVTNKASKKSKEAKKVVKKVIKKAGPVFVEKAEKVESSGKVIPIMPLGDRVIVAPFMVTEAEVKNNFGIILPEKESKERPEQGEIVAVGPGRTENGKLIPVKVKVGDKVVFSRYGFDEVKIDDKEFYILKEENILAILK